MVAGALLGAGCPAAKKTSPAEPSRVVLVVPLQTNATTGAFLELARETFPSAELYPAPSRVDRSGRRHVLLVLQADQLDPIQWPALAQSMEAGAPLLFWGLNPLQKVQPNAPDVPLISPAFRRFDSTSARLRLLETGEPLDLAAEVQSPFPRPEGVGGDLATRVRWIPLAESENETGGARAWPASLWVEAPTGGAVRSFGWVGVGVPEEDGAAVQALLRIAVQRLQEGVFLIRGGADRITFDGAMRLEVAARVAQAGPAVGPLRVAAELKDSADRVTRRVSASAQEEVMLSLGTLPRLADRARDYTLHLSLQGADDQKVYDQLQQAVRILPTAGPVAADWIGVTGSGFTLGRRPLFIFGAPLALRSSVGLMPGEVARSPLDAAAFQPEAVRRELDLAQTAGLNVLDVSLEQASQAPALRWLMEEMRARSMWLYVRVAGLDPLEPDLDRAQALLDAAHLLRDPVVFAFEVGSSPWLGREDQRRRLDEDWRQWLIEQYGSLERSEKIVGQTWWRHEGQITGPPDEALAVDGEGRAAVALYRRFLDDWFSRRLGHLRRFLAERGSKALMGARRGWGGPPERCPLDPSAGWIHLDFVALDAAGLEADDAARGVAAFSTVYARSCTLGKPVLWMNLGHRLGAQPDRAALAMQAERVQEQLSLVLRSHAAGAMVMPLPGGYRPAEEADVGFTRPDGLWRPAGETLRRVTLRVRREASSPRSWNGPTIQRDDDARGPYGLMMRQGEGYRAQEQAPLVEVRPQDFGVASTELVPMGVGGLPYETPAPWRQLNGEWGALRSETQRVERLVGAVLRAGLREKLELELWNTGPARWSAGVGGRSGSIWVRASHPEAREQWVAVADTPSGQHAVVRWTPADSGRWTLRMWSWSQGGFGEPLQVEVE